MRVQHTFLRLRSGLCFLRWRLWASATWQFLWNFRATRLPHIGIFDWLSVRVVRVTSSVAGAFPSWIFSYLDFAFGFTRPVDGPACLLMFVLSALCLSPLPRIFGALCCAARPSLKAILGLLLPLVQWLSTRSWLASREVISSDPLRRTWSRLRPRVFASRRLPSLIRPGFRGPRLLGKAV